MGSFKQVTLAGYLHGNSSHPKLFLPVWKETLQKQEKAEVNSGFLSYDPSPLENYVFSLNITIS